MTGAGNGILVGVPGKKERMKKGCLSGNSMNGVACLGVGGLTVMSFLLYISILVSPGILQNILQDVIQCQDFQHPQVSERYWVSNVDQNNIHNFEYRYSTGTGKQSENSEIGHSTESALAPALQTTDKDDILTTTISSHGRSITMHCCACEGSEGSSRVPDNLLEQVIKSQTPKIRILVGVLTMASKVERRNLLRLAYRVQSSEDAVVNVRFVMGALSNEADRTMVGMENATYGDIIVLSCEENLNEGKTFTYFSSLPGMGVVYDYVMKTDDDSYVRVENLARHLVPLPRMDLYYGYILPCESSDAYSNYMAGMGYLISWDLVEWIADSPIPRNMTVGTEDQLVADWFNAGGMAKNRVNDKPLFYDHSEFGGGCAHELIPESILIHQLKTPERWAEVLKFFENDRISRALNPATSPDV